MNKTYYWSKSKKGHIIMKHISKRTAMCAAVLGLSAVLSSCGSTPAADPDQTDIITVGVSEGGMEVDTPETSARIVLPPTEPVVIEEDESALLLDRVNNCIYLYEYGKAVKLMEDNPEESSDPSFDDAKNELLVHFTQSAKNYYTAAATYITKQEVMGYDFSTGFEGYSAEDSSLDPNVLSELVSDEDKVVINRTHIECSTDYSFKVTVTFCGMTAVYPAEDITLE